MYIQGLRIDWDRIDPGSYINDIPSIRNIREMKFNSNINLLSGENGSGKSTLIEAIAVAWGFNPEGGTPNYDFSTYDDVSELGKTMTLIRGPYRPKGGYFFRAESFFNVATAAARLYNDGSMEDYHAQSHGESFLSFLMGFDGQGIFIMDEPEAALSPQRQLSLLIHIHEMAAKGSQFIIATHSPILLGIPDADILAFTDAGIIPCRYEDTESYQITRMFIEDRERLLSKLL